MEYQNLLDDTMNQPSKLRARNWVKINDELRSGYNDDGEHNNNTDDNNNNIKFNKNINDKVKFI